MVLPLGDVVAIERAHAVIQQSRAGSSRGGRLCSACGGGLVVGEVEYEVQVATVTMFMHVRGVELWSLEGKPAADDG